MDTPEYIASGILELYVMGTLSLEEIADVERRAVSDVIVAEEIREIRAALSRLDQAHQRAPRAELRASIMSAIENEGGSASRESISGTSSRSG
ncbi:MAG: hypothetical protein H7X80_11265, partial [bacterium]|nr:hypothetical protein [Candidatus Kapabacteria bacterium]